MQEIVVALFAIGIGVLFNFYGYKAMRFLFPLWGLVAGYWAGARLVEAITGNGFFSTALSIAVGIAFGLVFAVLAYLFYAVAVLIFMGTLGYWIGAGLLIWVGLTPGIVTALAGIALGAVFVVAGLMADTPKYFLLFLTAFAGAALIVSGLLLMGNIVELPALKDGVVRVVGDQSWFWQVLWIGLGVIGFVAQINSSASEELQWMNEWEDA